MPGAARARNKRFRARAAAKPAADPIWALVKQMHLPMEEARGLMQALVLMGHGMAELGRDEAGAVLTLARAACARLDIIDDTWTDMIQIARV
jgi:hypothetical protein